MGSILQDGKAPQISGEPPQAGEQVLFFPVRHHSPACSYQLTRLIALYDPEIILIEGPENANELIPVLTDPETTLPAAIYYFYKDKKKLVSEDGRDYHCYYPFAESSPEYTAMRQARARGIEARFIDLPYSEILIHTKDFSGLRSAQERHSYGDDGYLTQSLYYKKLCEKTGVRSFEEFWEKYFEIAGLRRSPEEFIRQMETYCTITRESTPPQQMEHDGTLSREQHMAFRIREQMTHYRRILVVTGGFHTPALKALLQTKVKPVKLHKFTPDVENCYPIAYSYEAADALRGYASGMPHPGFYDDITKRLREADSPEGVYADAALDLLTRTAKESAKRDIPVSIADASAAWSLTEGLAALRESPEPGYTEIADGVTGAFIKGERTAATSLPLELLSKLATGSGIGHIGSTTHVPPLIQDFEAQCKNFRLKITSAGRNDAEISLFTTEREMEKSRFFHRMAFLQTQFCKMLKGPDLHTGQDRSRVREVWQYARSPQVDAALVDHTTDGMTLREACQNIAAKRIKNERRCEVAAQVGVDCFLMGLTLPQADLPRMEEIIAGDGDFFSLGNGLHAFDMLHELRTLYGFADEANLAHLMLCFSKLLTLLPSMAGVDTAQAGDCIRICRLLYGITGRLLPERRGELADALLSLTRRAEKEPSVYGAAMGLLYAMDGTFLTDAQSAMAGYLRGTPEMRKRGALYLKGLFETARDIALSDESFLAMTDELLAGFDLEDFMEILPSLRLAFSYFTPQETQTIGAKAAALHGRTESDVLDTKSYNEALHAFGAQIDAQIFRILRE